jgi:hypothetical protein
MILDAARGLNEPRRMILRGHPGLTALFDLLGAAGIPGVSLVSVPEE